MVGCLLAVSAKQVVRLGSTTMRADPDRAGRPVLPGPRALPAGPRVGRVVGLGLTAVPSRPYRPSRAARHSQRLASACCEFRCQSGARGREPESPQQEGPANRGLLEVPEEGLEPPTRGL